MTQLTLTIQEKPSGPAADPFRFDFRTTRDSVPVYVQVRGQWLPGIVVQRGSRSVVVMLEKDRKRVKKAYGELRRRLL